MPKEAMNQDFPNSRSSTPIMVTCSPKLSQVYLNQSFATRRPVLRRVKRDFTWFVERVCENLGLNGVKVVDALLSPGLKLYKILLNLPIQVMKIVSI